LVVIQPGGVFSKVKDQPKLEAGVGHGELDVVRVGLLDGFLKSWMVPWPLDIERAPELINLRVLIDGPAAGLNGHGHQRPGY
jgi:hypothetical protein